MSPLGMAEIGTFCWPCAGMPISPNVPLALILLALLELNGARPLGLHVIGTTLVLARLVHAFGIRAETMKNPGRFIGAMATAAVTVISSVWLIITFVRQ